MLRLRSGNLRKAGCISAIKVKPAILALVVSSAAMAQVYPPVGYPGQSPYPGGYPYPGRTPGTGIPVPGRSVDIDYRQTTFPPPSGRANFRIADDTVGVDSRGKSD